MMAVRHLPHHHPDLSDLPAPWQAQHVTQIFQLFAFVKVAALSAVSFALRSRFAISAEVSPAASASPLVSFFLHTLLGIASSILIGSRTRASSCCAACSRVLVDWRKVLSNLDCASLRQGRGICKKRPLSTRSPAFALLDCHADVY